jgi:transposase
VDTSEQGIVATGKPAKRQRRSLGEKLRIVEETLEVGASVAQVARRHAVNANQVFYWRKQYREGRFGKGRPGNLLPVTVSEIPPNRSGRARGASFVLPQLELESGVHPLM